jgi:hypothetical protein
MPGRETLIDVLDDARCAFIRIRAAAGPSNVVLQGSFAVDAVAAGGWLATPADSSSFVYWFPRPLVSRVVTAQGHITKEAICNPSSLRVDNTTVRVGIVAPPGSVVDLVAWRLPLAMGRELRQLSQLETQPYFLWGSHTSVCRLADVYQHVIFGFTYENRFAWPHRRKICSENDAHALYVLLSGLKLATGKVIYDMLLRQLILSVLARQGKDGGFRHGEWTERMESHFRLQASAMHLMMDALADYPSPEIGDSLSRAAAFLSRGRDTLDCGVWFLHDELELNEEAMAQAPFSWVRTRVLGKSPANMLVLNTHLNTTITLDRYREIRGDHQYAPLIHAAQDSTRAALSWRPAEWLYRLVFWAVNLTLLPRSEQERLPVLLRGVKRMAWKYAIPNLHRLKARFPRFVMPGGYVDRAIPLHAWSFHYLTVNLMDLVRYGRRFRGGGMSSVMEEAFAFTHQSGILLRWAELDYERYALGFWAEALYLRCLDDEANAWRAWLVEATLLLEDLGMGLPPSVLGTNGEAVAMGDRRACIESPRRDVRVINLSIGERREFLLINCGKEPAPVSPEMSITARLVAFDAGGVAVEAASIPTRSWLRLRDRPATTSRPSGQAH